MMKFLKKYGLTALAVAVALIHSNRFTYMILNNSMYSDSLIVHIISLILFAGLQLVALHLILDGGLNK